MRLPPITGTRGYRYALGAAVLLALVLRLATVLESSDSPYHRYPVVDAGAYHQIAATGDPKEPFWQPPLYPWFLRAVYRAMGAPSPLAARTVQAALGALACLMVGLAVRRLAGPRASLGAALGMALLGSLIYFDNELLPASLAVFLVSTLLWLLVPRGDAPPTRRVSARVVAAGVALGLGGILLPTLAIPGGLLILWLWRREGVLPALVFAVIAALPAAGVTLRNYRFQPTLVPVSYNGGVNLWIGNNADYMKTVALRPGMAWLNLMERPHCEGGSTARAEESAFYVREVARFVREHPGAWLRIMGKKLIQTFSAEEIGRNRDVYDGRRESIVLRLLVARWGLPFAVLFPLAAVGATALVRARSIPGVPLILLGGVLASSLIFFPTARYRAPALPAMVALAAVGLPRARWRDVPSGILALAVSLVPHGIAPIPAYETLYQIGMDLNETGRSAEALPFLEKAHGMDPDSADIEWTLGSALLDLKRHDEAQSHLEHAARLAPLQAEPWGVLGKLWYQRGDKDKALSHLTRAVELDGCKRVERALLAWVLMDFGRFDEARAQLDEAWRVFRHTDPYVAAARRRLQKLTGTPSGAPPQGPPPE